MKSYTPGLQQTLRYSAVRSLMEVAIAAFITSQSIAASALPDPVETRVEALLGQLTLDEKIELLGGDKDYFSTVPIPRLGIPKLYMSDGPQGVRNYGNACHFPAGVALAATWDVTLADRYGHSLGQEARARGVHVMLGPGVNISRIPINGRNFEYFGEDPFLTSLMASHWIQGLQSEGVAATVKHYAGNNQELGRLDVDVRMEERTFHEIYLPAFRRAVEEGHVAAVMSAYNRFQGDHCTGSQFLQNTTLKEELGFRGVVMSDWGATHGATDLAAGLDLEMGIAAYFAPENIKAALAQNQIQVKHIDEAVRRLLRLGISMGFFDRPQKRTDIPLDSPESRRTALDVARNAIVLLKNANGILPLDRAVIHKIAVYGDNAADTPPGGGGSGDCHPFHTVSFLDGIRALAGTNVEVVSVLNPKPVTGGSILLPSLDEACQADAVIFCAGFRTVLETEGYDRTFALPKEQVSLIQALANVNPRVIVTVNSGAGISMIEWIDKVPAVLQAWYLGQEGGTALAEIIYGDNNPSGRLPCTFDRVLEDNPAFANYPGKLLGEPTADPDEQHYGIERYDEGIFVGYRGYDRAGKNPMFPFGYGLSYTTFEYSSLNVRETGDGGADVSLMVKNTGNRAGAEVVQIYVGQPVCSVERPVRELKGFAKVSLRAGEAKAVEVQLPPDSFAFWNPQKRAWDIEPGLFTIEAGHSSREISLTSNLNLTQPAVVAGR